MGRALAKFHIFTKLPIKRTLASVPLNAVLTHPTEIIHNAELSLCELWEYTSALMEIFMYSKCGSFTNPAKSKRQKKKQKKTMAAPSNEGIFVLYDDGNFITRPYSSKGSHSGCC